MTLNAAADRLWIEVGQYYRGSYRQTFETALEWLVLDLGKNTLISDIGKTHLSGAIGRRRGDGVSNATINRTVTEPLRRILSQAKKQWGQTVQTIDWKDFMLPEPKERIRELRQDEEARLFEHLREDYHPIVRFALISGFRLAECVNLTWGVVDWGGRTITVTGKGDKTDTVPLTKGMRAILWPLQGQHETAIFCYRPQRSGDEETEPHPAPITYEGMKTQWRRTLKKAKIVDFRFHDCRHTTATRLLRSSGNLRLVQRLLRHEDVTTTTKYAHADVDDLRQAMEQAESGTGTRSPGIIPEKRRGISD